MVPLPRRRGRNDRRLRQADRGGFRALAALGDVDDDALTLVEAGQAGALQRRGVDEHVLAAVVAHDEAEPLDGIVPFDRAGLLAGDLQGRPIAAAGRAEPAAAAGTRRPRRAAGAGIDAQHLGDLRPALSRRDAHLERVAGLDLGNPVATQHRRVQKGVARAVRQLDEAEAFLRFEPFDDGAHRWSRWLLETWPSEP